MANTPKVVDREALKEFRKRNDQRYVLEGEYSPITKVGNADTADNLTPYSENSGIAQHEPFVFQSTGGSANVGALCQLKALRGQSYVLNQLVDSTNNSKWYATADATKSSFSDGVLTFIATATSGRVYQATPRIIGHKYLATVDIKLTSSTQAANNNIEFIAQAGLGIGVIKYASETSNWQTLAVIFTAQIDEAPSYPSVQDDNTSDWESIQVRNMMFIDLTSMFGVGNEPTTVEEFNRLFPLPYYEYSEGELVSCQASKLITVGYNQFDGQWTKTLSNSKYEFTNYVKVIPGQEYVAETPDMDYDAMYFHCYDEELNFIKNASLTTVNSKKRRGTIPNNAHYVKVEIYKESGITEGQFAFHLRWDDSKTGYEPYSKHEYGLPNEVLRSAGSAYDEIKSNGTKITRIGSYTFTGNETGTIINTDNETGIVTVRFAILNSLGKTNGEMLAPVGTKAAYASYLYTHSGYYFMGGSNAVDFNLGKADVASTLAQLTGKTIYFELGTPVESESIAFQENIAIDDWGTMEFVSTYPQGNDLFYYVNYKAFIDSLGNREDIGFDANKVVSQEQLNNAVGDIDLTGYVKKTDLSIDYSDYQALTTEQRQALLDKGIQIIGTINVNVGGGNIVNPVLFPRRNFGTYSQGLFIAGSSSQAPTVGTYEQNHNATTLTIKVLFKGTDEKLTVQKLSSLNGKTFPAYPSDTGTFVLKCVNGTLTWVQE